MKYFATTFFLTTLFSLAVLCQNTDSLQQVISSSKPYKERIKAYLAYTESFTQKNFEKVMEVGNGALQLARSNGDSVSVAKLKRDIGIANYFTGKYDIAAKNYYEAAAILEKNPDNHRDDSST